MARIKGDSITFKVGDTEYNIDATSIVFTNEDADNDVVTFADAAAGGSYEWKCNITALQRTDADALHTFLWENAGTSVDFSFAPHGNVSPSAAEPHYEGTFKLSGRKPDIGGAANSTWTFSTTLDVDGDLEKVTTV